MRKHIFVSAVGSDRRDTICENTIIEIFLPERDYCSTFRYLLYDRRLLKPLTALYFTSNYKKDVEWLFRICTRKKILQRFCVCCRYPEHMLRIRAAAWHVQTTGHSDHSLTRSENTIGLKMIRKLASRLFAWLYTTGNLSAKRRLSRLDK